MYFPLPEVEWVGYLFGLGSFRFAIAPAIAISMAEPDTAILLPTSHFALMDCAKTVPIFAVGLRAISTGSGASAIASRLARGEACIHERGAAVLLKKRDRSIGFIQKLQASIAAQRQLALEAFRSDIPGVPGGRSLGELGIELGGIVRSHFVFLFLGVKIFIGWI